jgi:predicted O-methyltransferase YrrM
VTTELAQMMLSGKRPWAHASLADAFDEGLAVRYRAFPQKRAELLRFYSRALSLLPVPPAAILEIGVKGGASLVLWSKLFPQARIVGADISLPTNTNLPEGITLIEADQSKPETIAAIGERFGPFDFVIDDGSHVREHMVNSLLALLPHLNAGALYVVEDISPATKESGVVRSDGKIADLVSEVVGYFSQHNKARTLPSSPAAQALVSRVETLLFGDGVFAFVVNGS